MVKQRRSTQVPQRASSDARFVVHQRNDLALRPGRSLGRWIVVAETDNLNKAYELYMAPNTPERHLYDRKLQCRIEIRSF